MTTAAEMVDETSESQKDRQIAVLFPHPDDKGNYLLAEDVARIEIYRQFPSIGGRVRRIRVSRTEFRTPDGEFVINPYETDEDDLEEVFGGGEYYIEPKGHDGKLLGWGRTILVPGKMKAGVRESYEALKAGGVTQEEGEEMVNGNGGMNPLVQKMFDMLEKRADEAKTAVRSDSGSAAVISTLQSELDDLRKSHRTQLESLIAGHREEIARRAKEIDEERASMRRTIEAAQEDYASKRRGVEAELRAEREAREVERKDLRRKSEEEIEKIRSDARRELDAERNRTIEERNRALDERKRAEREIEAESKRRADDIADTKRRYESQIRELEEKISRMRRESDKEVALLTKENLDLRRDLADTPTHDEPPPPPSPGGAGDPNTPLWYRALDKWGGPIAKAVNDYVKNPPDGRPMPPAPPQRPQFAPPQQQHMPPPPQRMQPQPPRYQPPQPPPEVMRETAPPQPVAPSPPPAPIMQQAAPAPEAPAPVYPPHAITSYGPMVTFGPDDASEPRFYPAPGSGGWIVEGEEDASVE